jgi:hypothetical protein
MILNIVQIISVLCLFKYNSIKVARRASGALYFQKTARRFLVMQVTGDVFNFLRLKPESSSFYG